MKHNLKIVVSNVEATRESWYPPTWLVYRYGQSAVEVHVRHDKHGKPVVLSEGAA
jgi:hypothetical protein